MKLTITSGGRTVENAWGLVGNVVWSGDKQRAARTLTFRLATSEADPGLPAVECPVGAVVSFWDDGGAPLPVELLENRFALPLDGGIRQLPDFEFCIGAEPLGELVTARLKRAVLQPADDDDLNQHGRSLLRRAADHRGRRRRTAPA